MNLDGINKFNSEQRNELATWLTEQMGTAPIFFRPVLKSMLKNLNAGQLSQKQLNVFSRQLARALGIIPSTEKRKSGDPLGPLRLKQTRKPQNEREKLEAQRDHSNTLMDRYSGFIKKHQSHCDRLDERLKKMADKVQNEQSVELDPDISIDDIELSEQAKAESREYAAAATERLESGDGADPALQSVTETLMNANVVSSFEEQIDLEATLPEGVREEAVVKTMSETRVRYDLAFSVTRLELNVEKKVVEKEDGSRQIFSASTSEFGPPRFCVTWQTLASLVVLVGQFAMPLNRLATMLTTGAKRFTSSSLSRMAHYVAKRFVPIYLELCNELSESTLLAGDDTSCRVVEVSSYLSKHKKKAEHAPPWAGFRTIEEAQQSYDLYMEMRETLLGQRADGDREAQKKSIPEPPLGLQVGSELDFESPRRDGKGAKQSLNTTVITGRSLADDPNSMIVFYRSHLGSFGDLLEMLLRKRRTKVRQLIVQSDLSSTNLVTDPQLKKRFEIEYCGCMAHARRPFALYEDQDPANAPYMLALFKGLALHEHLLDHFGRNRHNVLAVRGTDSLALWKQIQELSQKIAQRWSKATPLGTAARYIIKHFKKLTAYLHNPQVEVSNNLRERLLRTEKLIEKSSMFRRTIEGRVVLDILRTILQTAVAAGVPAHEYLIAIMKTDPKEVAATPEQFTPLAWKARVSIETE